MQLSAKDGMPAANTYFVQCPSPFLEVPASIIAKKEASSAVVQGARGSARGADASVCMFPITLNAKEAGTYKAQLVLHSLTDMRVLNVEFVVTLPVETPVLEFATQARSIVRQEIPIVNHTEDAWKLNATVTGAGFTGPRDVTVGPGATAFYTLTFEPDWVSEVTGKLELVNAKTGDRQAYELHALAEEPLAVDNIVVECCVRETVVRTLLVANTTTREQTYRIESDLPGISGEV